MARNLTIFGVPNYGSLPYTTYGNTATVGIVPAGYEAAYLKTEEPSETSRITTLDPKDTQWVWDLVAPSQIVGMGIVNHNLFRGSQVRWISPITTVHTYEILAPNATVSSSNVVGNHLDVDESVSSPDVNGIQPSSTSMEWSINFGFPTPGSAPILGADMACVVLRARRVVVSGVEALSPKLTVELFESSVPKQNLGYRALKSTVAGGQVYIFPFDYAALSSPSGVNIQIKVTCAPGMNTIGGVSAYGVLEVLNVYSDPLAYANDTRWITVETEDQLQNVIEPTKSIHYIPSATWSATKGVLLIRSDQSNHEVPLNAPTFGSPINNPLLLDSLTYVEVGVAPIGSGLTLATGMTVGGGPSYNVMIEDLNSGFTLGGQSYGASSWRRRNTPPIELIVTRAELKILQQIAWTKGHSGSFYVVLEPDIDPTWQKFSAFWATLKNLTEPHQINYAADGTATYRVTVEFEEKL